MPIGVGVGMGLGNWRDSGGGGVAYSSAVMALSPSGYWKFDEVSGSTTFADASGNSLTATGTGAYIAGCESQIPAAPRRKSLCLAALGHVALASAATFNKTSLTPMSFVFTMTRTQGDTSTYIPFSKLNSAAAVGFQAVIYDGRPGGPCLQFGIHNGSDERSSLCYLNTFPTGRHHVVITWDGVAANPAKIYIDGVAQTIETNTSGPAPSNIGNSEVFRIGGRNDGLNYGGMFQDFAIWSTTELTAPQVAALYTAHETVDRSNAIPFILDTDGGSSDIGDLPGIAQVIHWHRMGVINLLGICVTAGDIYSGPAVRACLDWYGLTSIPVGAYKSADIHTPVSGPSKTIRDAFLPSASRDDATYKDPATFYSDALTGQAAGSVVVTWGGFANSIAEFLNASAANKTLWNAKVKHVVPIAGQWPNSSTAASPAGTFTSTGRGEWNLGGSDADPIGALEAQAATDFFTHSTVPHYCHGVEICGNVGSLGNFIVSSIPSAWATTNPLRLGFGGSSRTAWDPMGSEAGLAIALNGVTDNPYWSTTQITTPVIDLGGADVGQNTSSAGSSNNYYLSPKVGLLTTAQWRTAMSRQMDQIMCRET